jgi:hypothetical protein
MNSNVVYYSNLLCEIVISVQLIIKKIGSVKLGFVQQVFGANRSVITSCDCINNKFFEFTFLSLEILHNLLLQNFLEFLF